MSVWQEYWLREKKRKGLHNLTFGHVLRQERQKLFKEISQNEIEGCGMCELLARFVGCMDPGDVDGSPRSCLASPLFESCLPD